jgi:hypothetical protein
MIVNTHIHSPYSFSSFDSIEQAVRLAREQQVRVLGLSDFNTLEGYGEFTTQCRMQKIFPLYGVEFIALDKADRSQGLRWNDPQNPGTIYFCGKALDFPLTLSAPTRSRLQGLGEGTQQHIGRVIQKLNAVLAQAGVALELDYTTIRSRYAKNTVRERHVARALADALCTQLSAEQLRAALTSLFGEQGSTLAVNDSVLFQNELRNRLLKAGAPAFIEESDDAFFGLDEVIGVVLDGGGIPCYPILADGGKVINEREQDVVQLALDLKARNIHAVEFIPTRNALELLERYVRHFREQQFCVTFGTEHNTPDLGPLNPAAKAATPLSEYLARVSYEGACINAAHQQQRAAGKPGFVDANGGLLVDADHWDGFVALGEQAIKSWID